MEVIRALTELFLRKAHCNFLGKCVCANNVLRQRTIYTDRNFTDLCVTEPCVKPPPSSKLFSRCELACPPPEP